MEQVTVMDEARMPPETDEAIRRSLCAAFPEKEAAFFAYSRAWHGSPPSYSVFLERDRRVVAHAGVVDRVVRIDGTPVRAAGVQNVFVLPESLGGGLSGLVMNAAMREARGRGFDVGMLFCVPQIRKVYSRVGWIDLGEREALRIRDEETLPCPGGNVAMFFPLRMPALPGGVIHLHGNDW
jgi:GNAT superfamily N-acetyltransferase